MKIIKLLALLEVLSILALLSVTSCKKNIPGIESNKTPTSQTSGLNQQGNSSFFSGKNSPQISKYFVNHSPNLTLDDPYPTDCVVEAYTDIYALRVDCNGGNVLYFMDFIKIETNWASTSPNLIITVNGNQLSNTATYMGGESDNHCLAYYQLQNVPSWELNVIDFCTPQTLNITYTDPILNISASETITVGLNGCYIGSYQTQAWVSGANEISMALPFNSCICPGTNAIWPPSYTFRLVNLNTTAVVDRVVPYAIHPGGYFFPQAFTGLTSGTYEIWGKNNCPGINTIFVPGIPAQLTIP